MEYKYFFSPQPTAQKNEFIDNFWNALSGRVNIINKGKKPVALSIDYFRYSFQADVMILNWPEDILHLRFGLVQLLTSFISLTFFKLKGGKIIWICHNKDSHNKQYKWLRKLSRSFFINFSHIIIVLSKDALDHFSKIRHKVFFLNHPVYLHPELIMDDKAEESIDVLIWGNISPYKGLNEFIESYRSNKNNFGVKIIGKADKAYLEIIKQNAKGLNIDIIDKFLTPEELVFYFKSSRIILLPYSGEDTFSSGALIHSLCSNKIIIGPVVGNFIDLNKAGACLVYNNFTNLFATIKSLLNDKVYYEHELTKVRKGIKDYYNSNSWDRFVDEIIKIISKTGQFALTCKKVGGTVKQAN